MTLTDLIRNHLEQFAQENTCRGQLPRPKTIEAHRLHLERFALSAENRPGSIDDLQNLTVNFCKQFFLQSTKGTGTSNRNQCLAAITGFPRWLADDGKWNRGNLESWQRFHSKEYKRWTRSAPNHKFLTQEKLAAFFRSFEDNDRNPIHNHRDAAFFGLIFFGPSRLGEIRLIDMEHIRMISRAPNDVEPEASCEIFIPAANTKTNQEHTLRLCESSIVGGVNIFDHLEAYYDWRKEQSDTGPFFIALRSKQGFQPAEHTSLWRPSTANWHKILKNAAKRSGVKMTSHYLRHTFGEIAASALNERDLRQIYGHSVVTITRGYTDHDNGDRLTDAHSRVRAAIAKY